LKEYEKSDLSVLFTNADNILKEAKQSLRTLYSDHGLLWSDETIPSLTGDVYAKTLGSYLEKKTGVKARYEVNTTGRMRTDILLNNIAIESKLRGIFNLKSFARKWERLHKECPNLIHLVVGWRHTVSGARRVREITGKERHFMLSNIQTGQYRPEELERLVEYCKNYLD